jgi:hypothetical protein
LEYYLKLQDLLLVGMSIFWIGERGIMKANGLDIFLSFPMNFKFHSIIKDKNNLLTLKFISFAIFDYFESRWQGKYLKLELISCDIEDLSKNSKLKFYSHHRYWTCTKVRHFQDRNEASNAHQISIFWELAASKAARACAHPFLATCSAVYIYIYIYWESRVTHKPNKVANSPHQYIKYIADGSVEIISVSEHDDWRHAVKMRLCRRR